MSARPVSGTAASPALSSSDSGTVVPKGGIVFVPATSPVHVRLHAVGTRRLRPREEGDAQLRGDARAQSIGISWRPRDCRRRAQVCAPQHPAIGLPHHQPVELTSGTLAQELGSSLQPISLCRPPAPASPAGCAGRATRAGKPVVPRIDDNRGWRRAAHRPTARFGAGWAIAYDQSVKAADPCRAEIAGHQHSRTLAAPLQIRHHPWRSKALPP